MPKKKPTKQTGAKGKSNAKKKAIAKPIGAVSSEFAETFAGLRKVMAAFTGELRVTADEPRKFYVVTKSLSWRGGPMSFGAVMMGKGYVSYHLLPLYFSPELKKMMSPALKKRMQGKACLNFRSSDEALFAELGELTKAGLEMYRQKKFL